MPKREEQAERRPVRGRVAAYALTVAVVGVAWVARWLLDPVLADHLPYVTFFIAVAAAAWLGGIGPALLATGLGLVLAWYFFVPTRLTFALQDARHTVGLVMYLMVSLAFAGFGGVLRFTQRRSEGRRELLDTIEREVRESERRNAAVIRASLDCIIKIDAQGRIIEFNPAAEQTFGYRRDDVMGREMADLIIPPSLRERHRRGMAHYFATGEGPILDRRIELTALRADGTEFPIELTVTRIPWDGPPIFAAFLRDIADRKNASDQLRQYATELSQADQRKDEFLAMLAHELRNPLAPIRNAMHVLRLGSDANAVQAASEMMERQVGQIVRLVDDLLDVSRINRGKIELRKVPVELVSAVKHAVEAARPLIQCKDHDFTMTVPSRPLFVSADPTRLAQVLGNLIDNACKFTENHGRIWLTVEREGEQAVIRVRDTGIGIAADQLPRIFDVFVQVDTSLERSTGGLGIGLTMVKQLVEMHGGTVNVESAGVGHGTEFVVRLPIMAEVAGSTALEPSAGATAPTRGLRILVVDDNRDAAESLAMLLESVGNQTRTSYDGLEAVEVTATFKPDAVLLDIGLPKLNGYDACRRIRELPGGKNMVLIALTGWGQESHRQRSEEAGFNTHMVKPVDVDALMKLLAETGRRQTPS